jgi:hypothetical protein
MKGRTEIKVQGHLDKKRKSSFEGFNISYKDDYTILLGSLKDEAHMHGILSQIRDLNLKLISINKAEKLEC